jgi:hypothetical protein
MSARWKVVMIAPIGMPGRHGGNARGVVPGAIIDAGKPAVHDVEEREQHAEDGMDECELHLMERKANR